MKTELEQKDIEAIAQRVLEVFKPVMVDIIKSQQPESKEFMDVKGLAQYLKRKESWVYNKVYKKEIPFKKAGKFVLFDKEDIDLWLKNPYASSLNIFKPYQGAKGGDEGYEKA